MKVLKISFYILSLATVISSCENESINKSINSENFETTISAKKKEDKIQICHYDSENASWSIKNVNDKSINGHLKHGDKLLIDADGDGYVEALNECLPGGDCDDNNANVHPGAIEICNGIDDDCDGEIDEGVQTQFYQDLDGDGFGSSTAIFACSLPSGYAELNGDCDDSKLNVNPAMDEICGNGIDDNCNGQIDENCISDEIKALIAKLQSHVYLIETLVGVDGKLFGSVTNLQLADAIQKEGIEIDRRNITILNQPIKTIGIYNATIRFSPTISCTITFEVAGNY